MSCCAGAYLVSIVCCCCVCFFFQAEDGIRDLVRSRGLGDVYKRQVVDPSLKGISDIQVKFESNSPRVVYSGPFFGGISGYFTDDFVKTDSQGALSLIHI